MLSSATRQLALVMLLVVPAFGCGGAPRPTVAPPEEHEFVEPTVADIKDISLTTKDGRPVYCGTNGTTFEVEPLDARGKPFELGVETTGLVISSEPPGVLNLSYHTVISPLSSSLTALGQPVVITAEISSTGVRRTLTLEQDLGCPDQAFKEVGPPQSAIAYGKDGKDGVDGRRGDDGPTGKRGREGYALAAEAAYVVTGNGQRYVLVVALRDGAEKPDATLILPGTRFGIVSEGGVGGSGGHGGQGATTTCGTATAGGRGGEGGEGGRGGTVTLKVADATLADSFDLSSRGGDGGPGGEGGHGGIQLDCNAEPGGEPGPNGDYGPTGPRGPTGKTDTQVVPLERLTLVRAALAAAPALTLETATLKSRGK